MPGSHSPESIQESEPELVIGLQLALAHEKNQRLKARLEQAERDKSNLKQELGKAEEEIKNKEEKIKEFDETKAAVKRLYAVTKAMLGALLGNEERADRNYKVVNAKVIDKLSDDLQVQLVEWQRDHQLLDKETKKVKVSMALKIKVARQKRSKFYRAQQSNPVIPHLNPVRRCKIQAYRPRGSFSAKPVKPAQFSCDCRRTYSRLSHVCSEIEARKNVEMIPNCELVVGKSLETSTESEAPSFLENEKDSDENEVMSEPEHSEPFGQPMPLMVLMLMDPTFQEHRLAGAHTATLPPEQGKTLSSPEIEIRHCCKCGRNFPNYTALSNHIKTAGNSSIGNGHKCELCKQELDPHSDLQTHLGIKHGVEYWLGRFVCLECGEYFSTNNEIVNHQTVVHGKDNNDNQ